MRFVQFLVLAFIGCNVQPALSVEPPKPKTYWFEVEPGVWRTWFTPYSYALQTRNRCFIIGTAAKISPIFETLPAGISHCELVLMTHHHRDSSDELSKWMDAKIPIRAPAVSEANLSPIGVKKYWDVSLPQVAPGEFPPLFRRYWSDWSFLVHPTGVDGIKFDLHDGDAFDWGDWKLKVVATPGHSQDHVAYIVTREGSDRVLCFCGDALCAPGKIWSPYTTEWHHQQDEGLRAASESLRKLGHEKPTVLYPEHGEPIREHVIEALQETSLRLETAAQLKNFDVYTKQIVGNPPSYNLLASEQVGTANPTGNPVPWTKLSPHLYLTGNTYALASKDGPVLLVDPYAQNLVARVEELKKDYNVGPVEVMLISHAHNDHYTGIFALPDRKAFQVWTLDLIADVVDHPHRYRAPYVDPRTPNVDRKLKDGEVVKWHEYELKIHHHPGQTKFAMGVEVEIDGKHCLFSGDNFYHMDQYTGSGGWSGRNTGLPGGYDATAKAILAMQPDWILAEHGGAFEFNAEDFQRRVDWANKAAAAADALSPHDLHTYDWDPQRIRIEPTIAQAKAGEKLALTIVASNPLPGELSYNLQASIDSSPSFPAIWKIKLEAGETARQKIMLHVPADLSPGRHVIPFIVRDGKNEIDPADVFVVLEIGP